MAGAATVHILAGPAGSGKTASLLARFRDCTLAAPGTTLWLAPTQRAAAEVRTKLLHMAVFTDFRIDTFKSLAISVLQTANPEAVWLSAPQRRLLLENTLTELRRENQLDGLEGISATTGFGAGLLDLFDEMGRAGVDPAILQQGGFPESVYGKIFERYHQTLEQYRLEDAESYETRARESLVSKKGKGNAFRTVFLDGFNDFTSGEFALFEGLIKQAKDVWITLLDEPGNLRDTLFSRPRATRDRMAHCKNVAIWFAANPKRPAGLAHLGKNLFLPLKSITQTDDAQGIALMECPGQIGEVRMVARRIKSLPESTPADGVLVVARDLDDYADIIQEVFTEYEIPHDVEGETSLTRNPAVALLLRALCLPDDGWPFAGVTALLRHTYFRPAWETVTGPETGQRAEALLRMLGEPHGRAAYRNAVDRWAKEPRPGLEDEDAEEWRRQRIHRLAKECRPFLFQFFDAWNTSPERGALEAHLAFVRSFAGNLGIDRAAQEDTRDKEGWDRFWAETDVWLARERARNRELDRPTFLRRLSLLAEATGQPRTEAGPGKVRVLSAFAARHLDADVVFLIGMGERGFPKLGSSSLLHENRLRPLLSAGLPFAPVDPLADEMLLFYQVATRARKQLVLSYQAVDDRGQKLLAGSFFQIVIGLFGQDLVPTERRHMLLQGLTSDVPLSAAEVRVRKALEWNSGKQNVSMSEDLWANLAAAQNMEQRRFKDGEFNEFDGLFRAPAALAEVAIAFGPKKVFSPTTLEDYVTCPFRFYLRHGLRLEPLEDPREEIELTRRGLAIHRALARLHRKLLADGIDAPNEEVGKRMQEEMGRAIEEDIQRAPSLASKELWRLEGERMLRLAKRYPDQWNRFLKPWNKRKIAPKPHLFEVDFGLPAAPGQTAAPALTLRLGEEEVLVSGRVDRIDIAELDDGTGFWIIDYKTGLGSHYTGTDLARFSRLQLTIYALGAEEVLLAKEGARPMGLAYWLVGEEGPKIALPQKIADKWLDDPTAWPVVRENLRRWIMTLVRNIRQGNFPLAPRSPDCTLTCPFGQVCRITQSRSVGKIWDLPLPLIEQLNAPSRH
jgi:ATP-dependent helicase/nuclease subunit B